MPRSELELDWRPLFRLYWLIRYKKLEENGQLLLPKNIQKSLESLIAHCRIYFSRSATREILAELHPMMCTWDIMFPRALLLANLFLPTMLTVDEHRVDGAVLWFDLMWHWYADMTMHLSSVSSVLPKLFTRFVAFKQSVYFSDWPSTVRPTSTSARSHTRRG